MAQKVGYFENNVTFKEGPFVLVDAGGWRIEVKLRGHHCPVLPHSSIYPIKERLGWPLGKINDTVRATLVCDKLNEMVRAGKIVEQDNGLWVHVGQIKAVAVPS